MPPDTRRANARPPPPETGEPDSWQGLDFDFTEATFDGGDLSGAVFCGGTVSFDGAMFSDGSVDLRSVASWAKPPHFDTEVLDNPPRRAPSSLSNRRSTLTFAGRCCWAAADGIDADPGRVPPSTP